MSQNLKLQTSIQPRLAMTQQMRQAFDILQMSQSELDEWLQQEIEKNPLIEYSQAKPIPVGSIAIAQSCSLHDFVMQQIRELFCEKEERKIAEHFLNDLDEKGFITHILDENLSEQEKSILLKLQTLDPPGIFARNLQESLLIQSERKNNKTASMILRDHFNDFLHGRFQKIKKQIGEEEFEQAVKIIALLKSRPGSIFQQEWTPYIKPDLIFTKEPIGWSVRTEKDGWPKLIYQKNDLFKQCSTDEERKRIQNWADAALSILRALQKRKNILIKLGICLVKTQQKFLEGEEELKPLSTKELAKTLHVHESTISRALSTKYALTPKGLIPLKSLLCPFPKMSAAKQMLKKLISQEDKRAPFSDKQLMQKLQLAGLRCARRTIVKYRQQMDILSSSQRKQGPSFSIEKLILCSPPTNRLVK